MKLQSKIRRLIGVLGLGLLIFTGVQRSDATEIKFLKIIYGKSVERGGKAIIDLALLDSSKVRTQEAMDHLIRGEASEGRFSEEALAAFDAVEKFTVSQIDRERGMTILRLSNAKARTADIVSREEAILGPAAIAERIRALNRVKAKQALIDAEDARLARRIDARERQLKFVRHLVQGAQKNWATDVMGKAVFTSLQGEVSPPVPSDAVLTVKSTMGFGALDNFRFATGLLEDETGRPMAHLLPAVVTAASSGSQRGASEGWGGFWEFGFFAMTGFLFSMWTLARTAMRDGVPGVPIEGEEEAEEEYVEYKKAA